MPASGASCPLPRVVAKVPSPSPQRLVAVGKGSGAIIHQLDWCLSSGNGRVAELSGREHRGH